MHSDKVRHKDFMDLEEVLTLNSKAIDRKQLLEELQNVTSVPTSSISQINEIFARIPEKQVQ
jgi:hypothetical protein